MDSKNTSETATPTVQTPKVAGPSAMRLERQGVSTVPVSRRFPQVRGGQCEFCGTLDPHVPGEYQYKLCPHYRGMELRCGYCPESKDQEEVVKNSKLNVAEHPYQPGVLVVWCDSYECSRRHENRFKISR